MPSVKFISSVQRPERVRFQVDLSRYEYDAIARTSYRGSDGHRAENVANELARIISEHLEDCLPEDGL
jgi:hypothetical protein